MKVLFVFLLLVLTTPLRAQTTEVDPADVTLTVTVENPGATPYVQEMVLVTIHGRYRRHLTREKLEQPDLEGFNWMQLGPDQWFDTTERGKKVKNFRRRMALFPDRSGRLTIGAFTQHLTLTDEVNAWFGHDIMSEPMTIEVAPAPVGDEWWLPVRQIEVSDNWSNAPDQLQPGEGVLRVIRVEAVGASPDMLPPMPELRSPSAMIFAHPEKRLVELSPEGPVSIAFWRWTIRPGNDTSAIVEPIGFDYFDTRERVPRAVSISAQRVAMDESTLPAPVPPAEPSRLRRAPIAFLFTAAMIAGLGTLLLGRRFEGAQALRRFKAFDPLRRNLRRAAAAQDVAGLRRAAEAMLRRDGENPVRRRLLDDLDRKLFASEPERPESRRFASLFLAAG